MGTRLTVGVGFMVRLRVMGRVRVMVRVCAFVTGLGGGPGLTGVHVAVHAVDADVGVFPGQGGAHADVAVVGVLQREAPAIN